MKYALASLIVLTSLVVSSSARSAPDCDCMGPGPPAEERKLHTLVFLGTVESVRDSTLPKPSRWSVPAHAQRAIVHMQSIWKGTPEREITISGISPEVCEGALKFRPGESYLFYVDSTADGWWADFCSRTRTRARAAEDLAALGKPVIVQRLPGRKPRSTR
ncbi:MAG: hypothetical protein ABI960_01860 [Candidatus Eisenbacteria bacterium]